MAVPKAFAIDATRLSGEVCYGARRIPIAADELTADRLDQIVALIRSVADKAVPPATPSAAECGWCDIPASDCAVRIDTPVMEAAVTEF
jgi:hypothetical protein